MIRLSLALVVAAIAWGQSPEYQEFGHLGLGVQRAPWPDPESVVHDLRSSIESDRLRAFGLVGVSSQLYFLGGGKINEPEEVRLTYTRLGEDQTTHAIVSLQLGQHMYAAIAAPVEGGWERLARFNCWCKYDMEDPLGSFLEIRSGPIANRLVMRGSGGGSGLYTQTETHFIVHQGSVRELISFVSRNRSCPAAPMLPCEIERRWFDGSMLVEAKGKFPDVKMPNAVIVFRDAEIRYADTMSCQPYRWDAAAVRYVPEGSAGPCP